MSFSVFHIVWGILHNGIFVSPNLFGFFSWILKWHWEIFQERNFIYDLPWLLPFRIFLYPCWPVFFRTQNGIFLSRKMPKITSINFPILRMPSKSKNRMIWHQNSSHIGLLKGRSLPPNLSCPDSFFPPSPPPTIITNTLQSRLSCS